MNIHPLFVHFPVALLSLYAVIRILPLGRIAPSISWRDVERVLLFFGTIGAFVALQTGEIAEQLVKPSHDLVEVHSNFATITTYIFGALTLGEICAYIRTKMWFTHKSIARVLRFMDTVFTHRTVSFVLAVVGLIALFVTGVLGGALVYGTTADPFAPFLISLFRINL